MAVDRPLTIRDYLEPRQVATAGSRLSGAVTNNSASFQNILKNEKSKDVQAQTAGLTISEYLNRRVSTKPTARTLGRAGAGGSVATPADSPELIEDSAVARQVPGREAYRSCRTTIQPAIFPGLSACFRALVVRQCRKRCHRELHPKSRCQIQPVAGSHPRGHPRGVELPGAGRFSGRGPGADAADAGNGRGARRHQAL